MHVKGQKRKVAKIAAIEDSMENILGKIDESLNSVPTDKLLKYFELENERTKQHEMKFFTLLLGGQGRENFTQLLMLPPTAERNDEKTFMNHNFTIL